VGSLQENTVREANICVAGFKTADLGIAL
jgi:hypothetical protein